MMKLNAESTPILKIPNNTNYWLIRANGGKFYADFLDNGFIALGHNKVLVDELNHPGDLRMSTGSPDIRRIYTKYYLNESKQGISLRSNQINNFFNVMKIGDVVIVPSKKSQQFAIGIILSGPFDADTKKLNIDHQKLHPYVTSDDRKRRKVYWMKEISKSELPKGLLWVLSAHEALFHIKEDIDDIDKLISPLYIKDGKVNLVIGTQIKNDISMTQWNAVTSLSEEAQINPNTVKIDIQRNSPPTFTFICATGQIHDLYRLYQTLSPVLDPVISTGGVWGFVHFMWKIIGGKRGKELGLIEWIQEINSNHLKNRLLKEQVDKSSTDSISKRLKTISQLGPMVKSLGSEVSHQSSKNDVNSPSQSEK